MSVRGIRNLFMAVCLTVLLFGFAASAAAKPAGEDGNVAEWTVMFYIYGSNLDTKYAFATGNFEEIASCSYPREDVMSILSEYDDLETVAGMIEPERVNVLIETGGCQEWHASSLGMDITSDALQYWRYECYVNDDIPDGFYLEEPLPLASMSDPETLTGFYPVWSAGVPGEEILPGSLGPWRRQQDRPVHRRTVRRGYSVPGRTGYRAAGKRRASGGGAV